MSNFGDSRFGPLGGAGFEPPTSPAARRNFFDIRRQLIQLYKLAEQGGTGGGSGFTYMQDTEPSNPSPGEMWWDTTTGLSFFWYDDGDSQQWVQFAPGGGNGSIKRRFYETVKNDGASNTLSSSASFATYITNTDVQIPLAAYDQVVDLSWYVQLSGDCSYAGIQPRYRTTPGASAYDKLWTPSWGYSSPGGNAGANDYHNVSSRRLRLLPAGYQLQIRLYGYANVIGVQVQAANRTYTTAVVSDAAEWETLPDVLDVT